MTAPAHDLPVVHTETGTGTDLAAWDAAVTALLASLTGADFGLPGPPALLLASAPAALVHDWAGWLGVAVTRTPDGGSGFPLSETVHVAVQSEVDRRFLGPDVLFLTAVDGDGAWCRRGVRLPLADVVGRHGPVRAAAHPGP